jgi:hypothetical protein
MEPAPHASGSGSRARHHISFADCDTAVSEEPAPAPVSQCPPVAAAPDGPESSTLTLHLGLVKERRTYRLEFELPPDVDPATLRPTAPMGTVQALFYRPDPATPARAAANVHAVREGTVADEFCELAEAAAARGRAPRVVLLGGRVMGANRGTPMLRPEVHCIGVDPEPESECDSAAEDRRRM